MTLVYAGTVVKRFGRLAGAFAVTTLLFILAVMPVVPTIVGKR